MVAEVQKSANGQRVIRECQEALNLPVNSDPLSRKLVLARFANEVDLFPDELEMLLPSWTEAIVAAKQKKARNSSTT